MSGGKGGTTTQRQEILNGRKRNNGGYPKI